MRTAGRQAGTLNAYVSASSRGLAFEIARGLAAGGANIALSSRSADRLDVARRKIVEESPSVRVLTVPGDLCRVDEQERILAFLDSNGFVPDVFVCNAGHPRNRRLSSLSRPDWESDLEMILGHAVFTTRKLAPAMAERGFGRIILLSSIYAKTPSPDYFMSSLSRAGLFTLSKIVGEEYASRGLASFVVCLGFVDTPMVRNLALERPLDAPDPESPAVHASWNAKYEEWAAEIPAKRIASPGELSRLVAFLVSPEAEYLNGTVFSFSGGLDRGLV